MPLRARYDRYADWYEAWNKPHAEHNASEVRDLLGAGSGLCLDLGCGSGHYFETVLIPASTARTPRGWTTAGYARTPPIVWPAGIKKHRGGANTCAGGSACATTRWLICLTHSSTQVW
jgi:hypothetical protein